METNVPETKTVVRKITAEGKFLNQYLKIKTIGEGPYSKIKLMKNIINNQFYAMKKYNLFILKKKNKLLKKEKGHPIYITAAQEVLKQVEVLKIVKHPHIASLIEIIQDQTEEKLYLFLEYCEKGDIATWSPNEELFTLHKDINNVQALVKAFLQIAKAIHYLHSNNIVHRDLKPQNILLNSHLDVKIIDFGRAVKLANDEQRLRGSEGTYHFMAPQMLSEIFKQGYNGKKCDMWSLGVTFYCILFRTLPFNHQLLIKLFELIEKGEYKFPASYPAEYQIFIPIITNLLKVNPVQRITAEELISKLQKLQ